MMCVIYNVWKEHSRVARRVQHDWTPGDHRERCATVVLDWRVPTGPETGSPHCHCCYCWVGLAAALQCRTCLHKIITTTSTFQLLCNQYISINTCSLCTNVHTVFYAYMYINVHADTEMMHTIYPPLSI